MYSDTRVDKWKNIQISAKNVHTKIKCTSQIGNHSRCDDDIVDLYFKTCDILTWKDCLIRTRILDYRYTETRTIDSSVIVNKTSDTGGELF